MAGRLTDEARREKARNTLIETIAKINDVDSPLGEKWKKGMVAYYVGILAELLISQVGCQDPSGGLLREMGNQLHSVLGTDSGMET